MNQSQKSKSGFKPVAIGGLGGSGTRAVADIIRSIGYYIGDDLNISNDNLWFTILFKKTSIILDSDFDFARATDLFFERMEVGPDGPLLSSLASIGTDLFDSEEEWLAQRYSSFMYQPSSRLPNQPWAWKEPNTHIVIERLLRMKPSLLYIHVTRNPFYMAYSHNQNQLGKWGSIMIGSPIENTPRFALKFWCAVHRRIQAISAAYPGRMAFIDFDDMCRRPEETVISMATFLGVKSLPIATSDIAQLIRRQPLVSSLTKIVLSNLDEQDVDYVRQQGFEIPL